MGCGYSRSFTSTYNYIEYIGITAAASVAPVAITVCRSIYRINEVGP